MFYIIQGELSFVKGTRRHRYIDFHVDTKEQNAVFTNSELLQALRQQAFELFSKNLKDLRLWVIDFDGMQGILKCHYREKDPVIQLIRSIRQIGAVPVVITTGSTSGTIRGLTHVKKNRP